MTYRCHLQWRRLAYDRLVVFVDVGRITHNDPLTFERDVTLVGAGVGTELSLRRNLIVRAGLGLGVTICRQRLEERIHRFESSASSIHNPLLSFELVKLAFTRPVRVANWGNPFTQRSCGLDLERHTNVFHGGLFLGDLSWFSGLIRLFFITSCR